MQSSSSFTDYVEFTKKVIIEKIIKTNHEFKDQKIVKVDVKLSDDLNGFMSNILHLKLETENEKTNQKNEYQMIVKIMKGTEEMKKMMKTDIQFSNEVYFYREILPAFLKKFKFTIHKSLWCPKVYLAEISDSVEVLLVLEDLAPLGYRLGGRSHLTPREMKLMAKAIAQFHACSYALKIQKDSLIDELRSNIIPLHFKDPEGRCVYDVLYENAFHRLFHYTIELLDEDNEVDLELKVKLRLLQEKYGKTPVELMESFLADDPNYSVILHGDYNRNNVLFRYDANSYPIDLRMIDFQQLRYGSPALDLSFYLYMNMPVELIRTNLFEELLQSYQKYLIAALCELLQCNEDDPRLIPYNFENLHAHLKKFMFYGAMISINFLPWMLCTPDECQKLTHLWFTNMDSDEFTHITTTCGGKETNERLMEIIRMAHRLNHLDIITK